MAALRGGTGSGRAATAAALGERRGRSAIASDDRDRSDATCVAQGIARDSAAARCAPRHQLVAPSSEMNYERDLAVGNSTYSPTKPEMDAAAQYWGPALVRHRGARN